MSHIRTRFAPSPTGYLHIGGGRTALYNYLFSKKNQGIFVLRIEDTDLERSTPESVQAILDGMQWLGLSYDEGPFYQTKRFDRYKEVIKQLLEEGKAYRCNCSKERLEALRTEQMEKKLKPRYDGLCRSKQLQEADAPFVIRFKNPLEGEVSFDDQVYGKISFNNQELDDLIIARADGSPTYNFTVVVDDWDMGITHVIRGDDHINNTPRQINILTALGAPLPIYAHLPMILGSDGKRLSKRHGAVGVMSYREMGILPAALLNYIVRLGWSYGDQEIFSMDEMVQLFDLNNINKAPAALNHEKLLWLNQHYLKTLKFESIKPELIWHFENAHLNWKEGPDLETLFDVQKERVKTLVELIDKSRCFYEEITEYDQAAIAKHIKPEIMSVLNELLQSLSDLDVWEIPSIHEVVIHLVEKHQLKMPQLAQPIRIAVTGSTVSPGIDQTLFLLGKDKTLKRLMAFR
ncbi:MAG: glutamate--tRNA ligase [Gammaproteobacteria bacterium]